MPRKSKATRTERPISEHGLCPKCNSILWQGAPPQPGEFPIDCPGGHAVSLSSLPAEYFAGEDPEPAEEPAPEPPGVTFPCPHCGTDIDRDDIPEALGVGEPSPAPEPPSEPATDPEPAPKPASFQCSECTKAYQRKSGRTRHVKKVHRSG